MGGTEGCQYGSEGCLVELRLKDTRKTRRTPSQDTYNRATGVNSIREQKAKMN